MSCKAERVRVLVVEDDPDIAALMEMVLADEGYPVLLAVHGGEALGLLDDPDCVGVILLDYRLPVMAAPEFVERFRARPHRGRRPEIVLFTAAADAPRLARELGLGRVLAKPAKLRQIVEAVGLALADANAGAAPAAGGAPSAAD